MSDALDARSHSLVPYLATHPIRRWDISDARVALLLFLSSLGLYTATLAPSLTAASIDSNELITKSALMEVAHRPGAPFYIWVGHLFTWLPFGEVATRVNWMSAFFGAGTIALLYLLLVRHATGSRLSAAGGAALFAISLTFWSQAVIAELYAPNMAFLALAILSLIEWGATRTAQAYLRAGPGLGSQLRARRMQRAGRRWLMLAAVAFGLSLGIHLSNVLYLPAFVIFALLGWPMLRQTIHPDTEASAHEGNQKTYATATAFDWRGMGMALAALSTAVLLPYTWLYFAISSVPPGDGFTRAAPGWPFFYENTINAFQSWRFGYSLHDIPERVMLFLQLLAANIGPLGLVLLALGAYRLFCLKPRLFSLLLLVGVANAVFYIDYSAPDVDVFFIPTFWVAVCFGATGLEALASAVAMFVRSRQPARPHAAMPAAELISPRLGLRSYSWNGSDFAEASPSLLIVLLVMIGASWAWPNNYAINNLSRDRAFADFYGNALPMLPKGSYLYDQGASMGYDLLYYTRLHKARPDIHVEAGPGGMQSAAYKWPPGPVFSGIVPGEHYPPDFIADNADDRHKWYEPVLSGMFRWKGNMPKGWLTFYRVRPHDLPQQWVVPADGPSARPSTPLNVALSQELTLIGIDAQPQAERGKPWHIVRYWRTTSAALPDAVTVLGNYVAIESHVPLFKQLSEYMSAAGIRPEDLQKYVIRDDMRLVIPSNIPPGRYNISVAVAKQRLFSQMVMPATPQELISNETVIATVDVVDSKDSGVPDPRFIRDISSGDR